MNIIFAELLFENIFYFSCFAETLSLQVGVFYSERKTAQNGTSSCKTLAQLAMFRTA